ncbi:MAG: hypothetical protein JWP44_3314 [Mucilaginibacter sp.]|nr:hypothetical protein [Mucilaginibacter sp.]
MNSSFEIIKKPRIHSINLIKDLSIEQLNNIPAGFNNNIIWNIAHTIAAQQGVCYKRAGLDIRVDEDFFQRYKPDTKPTDFIDSAEVEKISELLLTTIDQLETDYNNELFSNYTSWTTRYGVEINNIDKAINFLPFHEGLHFGYVMALKRAVANS